MTHYGPIPARKVGSGGLSLDEEPKAPAPRREALYVCRKRGCQFTLVFAAEAAVPLQRDCRCGGVGVLEGAPEGTAASVDLPGYTNPGGGKYKHLPGHVKTPWEHLLERRSLADLELVLAERLEAVRGGAA